MPNPRQIMGGGKTKPKKQGKKPGQDNKQNNNNPGQKGQDRGRDKSRDRDKPRDRDRSKSRDGRFTSVAPWPTNKPYLNAQGNGLVKEMQNHFAGHCFKCGHSSHLAAKCRIYTSYPPPFPPYPYPYPYPTQPISTRIVTEIEEDD